MKTVIRDKIFETSGMGQAPSKDFFHLTVTRESIIWRSWRITLRSNKSLPGETTHSWDEFVNDSKGTWLQGEIRRVFGVETLNIVLAMVTQTWLPYLKSDILTEILVRLDLRDIMRLAQVCRALYNACASDILWQKLYVKHFVIVPSDVRSVAEEFGWKKAFVVNLQKPVQTVRALRKVHTKLQEESSRKTPKEEGKRVGPLMSN